MANILDESNAVAEAVVECADGKNLPLLRRAQLLIGFALCRFLGIHSAVSVYIASRVERSLGEEVNGLIEASDLSNRYYSLQMSSEQDAAKVFQIDKLMRRSYKAFRAEQSNCQILIAKQRDEIGKLEGHFRNHEHEIADLTESLRDLNQRFEMIDSLHSSTLSRLSSMEQRTNAIP